MSREKLQAPRGTFDVLPEQAAARAAVEREARRIFEPAGYGRIDGRPIVEYSAVNFRDNVVNT